jgi:tyrosyl-tRNA synthetase
MRLADIDVAPMLKQLTFLPLNQIKEIESEHMKAPEKYARAN